MRWVWWDVVLALGLFVVCTAGVYGTLWVVHWLERASAALPPCVGTVGGCFAVF